MSEPTYAAWAMFALHGLLQIVFVIRATLRRHREPASRLAWVVVIIVAPVVGIVAYVLFGDTNIGSRRIARVREAVRRLSPLAGIGGMEEHTGRRHGPASTTHCCEPLSRPSIGATS